MMTKYWRLIRAVLRGIQRSYVVWTMSECERKYGVLYSCAGCGMALHEPCEHWLAMSSEEEGDQSEGVKQ